ncbi:MAG: DUF6122 family protein [Candidatus Marinimicrobia bacterium]|nr:DUF6122 family protein [Candidatus Neomarinimicrobiota bacterium]
MIRSILHIVAHFAIPAGVASGMVKWFTPSRKWSYYWILMVSTMLIDLDHLLAQPIYDQTRCSIGFHPLHSVWAIALYIMLLIPKRSRIIALGLVIHIGLDGIDCALM